MGGPGPPLTNLSPENERFWDLGSPMMAQRRSECVPSLVREDFGQGFSEI